MTPSVSSLFHRQVYSRDARLIHIHISALGQVSLKEPLERFRRSLERQVSYPDRVSSFRDLVFLLFLLLLLGLLLGVLVLNLIMIAFVHKQIERIK